MIVLTFHPTLVALNTPSALLLLDLVDFFDIDKSTKKQRQFRKRVTHGEPISFVILFGIIRLRAIVSIPRILHFLHPQMAEKLSRSAKAARNAWPFTKRTLHHEDVIKKVGRSGLKVSDSERRPLVWLKRTILIVLTC